MQLTSLLVVSREKVPSGLKMISSDTRPRQPMLVAPRHVPTMGLLFPPPFPPLPFPPPQAANGVESLSRSHFVIFAARVDAKPSFEFAKRWWWKFESARTRSVGTYRLRSLGL